MKQQRNLSNEVLHRSWCPALPLTHKLVNYLALSPNLRPPQVFAVKTSHFDALRISGREYSTFSIFNAGQSLRFKDARL
jgi:hypothetical protein